MWLADTKRYQKIHNVSISLRVTGEWSFVYTETDETGETLHGSMERVGCNPLPSSDLSDLYEPNQITSESEIAPLNWIKGWVETVAGRPDFREFSLKGGCQF